MRDVTKPFQAPVNPGGESVTMRMNKRLVQGRERCGVKGREKPLFPEHSWIQSTINFIVNNLFPQYATNIPN